MDLQDIKDRIKVSVFNKEETEQEENIEKVEKVINIKSKEVNSLDDILNIISAKKRAKSTDEELAKSISPFVQKLSWGGNPSRLIAFRYKGIRYQI